MSTVPINPSDTYIMRNPHFFKFLHITYRVDITWTLPNLTFLTVFVIESRKDKKTLLFGLNHN